MNIQHLYPSDDGDPHRRQEFLNLIERLFFSIDAKKDPMSSLLHQEVPREQDPQFYHNLVEQSRLSDQGMDLHQVVDHLARLAEGNPIQNGYFVSNMIPLSSIPGILGLLTMGMLNGNNAWDVHSPAASEAEVRVSALMSRVIGYDPERSLGYTTWGGQGAVLTSLRAAVAKVQPSALKEGLSEALYCFATENAHFSLLKSVQTMGIGSDRIIKVRTKDDFTMDETDLLEQMERVLERGGIPAYVVATVGTTDSFAMDDVQAIRDVTEYVTAKHDLRPIHVHADTAMGGMYAFFLDYDFAANPQNFEPPVLEALEVICEKMRHLRLADSVCFDFHKLGQTPYVTSMVLFKDAQDVKPYELKAIDSPYVGNRSYGDYYPSYTVESSRMGSSISIYAALLAFGANGYRELLGHYVRMSLAFQAKLLEEIPHVAISNPQNPGPILNFRIYAGRPQWSEESQGLCTAEQVEATNRLNQRLFDRLGEQRERVFFGDTKKQCNVPVADSNARHAVYAGKICIISPYTTEDKVDAIVQHLKKSIGAVMEECEQVPVGGEMW